MSSVQKTATVNLTKVLGENSFALTDVLTNETVKYNNVELSHVKIAVDGYTCRLLLINENNLSSGSYVDDVMTSKYNAFSK